MKVNDKVLCINGQFDNPNVPRDFQQLPIEGQIYTVRELVYSTLTKSYRVLLKEIVNKKILIDPVMGKAEPGFDARRFVPISEIEEQQLEVETIKIVA